MCVYTVHYFNPVSSNSNVFCKQNYLLITSVVRVGSLYCFNVANDMRKDDINFVMLRFADRNFV